MMLSPGYGETPIDGDEFDALFPSTRELLGEPCVVERARHLTRVIDVPAPAVVV